MGLDIDLHHLVDLVCSDSAGDGHTQRVADEIERMVVLQKFRILTEESALFRVVDVPFELRHPLSCAPSGRSRPAGQRFQIERLSIAGPTQRAGDPFQHPNNCRKGIGNKKCSGSGPANDDQFGRCIRTSRFPFSIRKPPIIEPNTTTSPMITHMLVFYRMGCGKTVDVSDLDYDFAEVRPGLHIMHAARASSKPKTRDTTGFMRCATMARFMASNISRDPTKTPCTRTLFMRMGTGLKSLPPPLRAPMTVTVPPMRTARRDFISVPGPPTSTTWSTPIPVILRTRSSQSGVVL